MNNLILKFTIKDLEGMKEANENLKVNLDLKNLDWKFLRYVKLRGYLVQIEPVRKEVVVFIPRENLTFIADVSSYVNLERLKVDKLYDLTFAVYMCKINKPLKKHLLYKLKEPYLTDKSRYRREYHLWKIKRLEEAFKDINVLYKFELLSAVDPMYSLLVKKEFKDAVLRSYKAPTKYRWRHFLGF